MYIGQISKLTGASPRAIRHYEALELMHAPQRLGTYRVYDDHHIAIISLIKRAQSLGFKLSELVPLLNVKRDCNVFPIDLAIEGIETKRKQLKRQIQKAEETDTALIALKQELMEVFV